MFQPLLKGRARAKANAVVAVVAAAVIAVVVETVAAVVATSVRRPTRMALACLCDGCRLGQQAEAYVTAPPAGRATIRYQCKAQMPVLLVALNSSRRQSARNASV